MAHLLSECNETFDNFYVLENILQQINGNYILNLLTYRAQNPDIVSVDVVGKSANIIEVMTYMVSRKLPPS